MGFNKVNFGIIGCGRIAPKHAQAIAENPFGKLIAVADLVPLRAKNYEDKYGALPFTDYRYLLDNKLIDVISICTPSGLHAQMAIDALNAGKNVIVEKPMALTVEDSEAMINVSERVKKKMCVVLQNRYNPPIIDLKQALEKGCLGSLLLCNATVRWYRPESYYEDGWHGTLSMDGGMLMNQAIHYIDILQWLVGEVDVVFSFTGTLAHHIEIDDTGVIVMRFRNGALGSIEASTITYPCNIEGSIAIFGKLGSVKIGGTALNEKVLWKLNGDEGMDCMPVEQTADTIYGKGHKMVVSDMIDALLTDREPNTNGRDGQKSIIIAEAIYKSASISSPVSVKQI